MADPAIRDTQASNSVEATSGPLTARTLMKVGLGLLGVVAFGFWRQSTSAIDQNPGQPALASQSAPAVAVLTVQPVTGFRDFALPASVEPTAEAVIYSRATGYLKRRLVDVGDHVKAGQLLAEVEAPEVDRHIQEMESQVQEARASVALSQAVIQQKRAQLDLALATNARISQLSEEGIVARQAADDQHYILLSRHADLAGAEAGARQTESQLVTMEARLSGLEELKSFQQVRAPFAGVITARKADVGSLLIPGTGSGPQELFRLVDAGQTRIVARIPQEEAGFLSLGAPCEIELSSPDRSTLQARIARSSLHLDNGSRTLLVELAPLARNARLVPGMYVQARFRIPASAGSGMSIPAGAVIVRSGRAEVAVLDAANVVHFREVIIGRDDGVNVDVIQGLAPGDRIVTRLSDAIRDNHPVRVMPPKTTLK